MDNHPRIESLYLQFKKILSQVFKVIEQAILFIPKVVFLVCGEFEIFVLIAQIFAVGLVWMWAGVFLMHHMKILRFILHGLNDYAIVVSKIYGLFGDACEETFNILAKGANIAGGAINSVSKFLHGPKLIPHFPTIPLTRFPVLNFEGFIQSLDNINDATTLCAPFKSVLFELLFPLRYALNDFVCPVVRYMTGTVVYRPFAWLLGMFYLNADPNDEVNHNCKAIEAQYICFFLSFGEVLVYLITPLMVFSFFWPFVSKLVRAVLKLAEDVVVFAFKFTMDVFHELFHRDEKAKKSK